MIMENNTESPGINERETCCFKFKISLEIIATLSIVASIFVIPIYVAHKFSNSQEWKNLSILPLLQNEQDGEPIFLDQLQNKSFCSNEMEIITLMDWDAWFKSHHQWDVAMVINICDNKHYVSEAAFRGWEENNGNQEICPICRQQREVSTMIRHQVIKRQNDQSIIDT